MIYFAFLLALLIPSLAGATTFYMSNSTANGYAVGSNSNNCTAIATPCLTRGGAYAKMSGGDTLIINDGVYAQPAGDGAAVIPSGLGTEETRTIIKCRVRRLCEFTTVADTVGFEIKNSTRSWITIQGLIVHCPGVCFLLNSTDLAANNYASHIKIDDNEMIGSSSNRYNLYTGYGQYNEFTNNTIHDCGEQCVYITARNSVFRGNNVYNSGIGPNAATVGGQIITMQTSGGHTSDQIVIEKNTLHDCHMPNSTPRIFDIGSATNITFRRNVMYGCTGGGIRAAANVGVCLNCIIEHNVITGATAAQGILLDTGSTGGVIRNNIVIGNSTNISTCAGCGATLTGNLTSGTAADLFVSPGTGDYRPKAGSVAIDGGANIGQLFNGAAPDQGAFETFAFTSCVVEDADPSTILVTFTNDVQPPLLPATDITGFTARKATANDVITSAIRKAGTDNIVALALTDAIVNGNAVDISYSAGNLTDSSLVGNTYNQSYLATLTNQSCTNNVGAAPSSAVLTQKYFRFHGLQGTEAAPIVKSIGGAISANAYSVPGGKIRLRLKVACTAADCAPLGMVLRYSLNSGSYTAIPDAFTADNIRFYASTNADVPTSGTATTELLTSDHVTNVAGALVRSANAVPTVDLSQNSETELEYAIELDTDVVAGDTYDFRLYDQAGNALTAYTVTPRLTVTAMQAGGGM